ncbi:unnamed protein product [Schistosoma mattheei]|uniref:Uncharacterized protein n=1 Tax=Schistosoma mattheei TaxID=31246 RepID=A0AA85BEB8_9TREM|nr:unnamed protein product [Schistosoma mattheei]
MWQTGYSTVPSSSKSNYRCLQKFLNIGHLTVAPGLGKTLDCSIKQLLYVLVPAVSRGISIILAGHSVTERGFFRERFIPDFRHLLSTVHNAGETPHLELLLSDADHEPGFVV